MRRAGPVPPAIARSLAAMRRRHADARARAVCPVDNLEFTPLYTDGHCPLCGWVPEGYRYTRPTLSRYDRHWGALGAIGALSVAMLLVVVFVLSNT
jgi:hypothetical protein